MPRSRVTEPAQRQCPPHLRTSSSSSDRRPRTDRSPKLGEGQSPRAGSQSDPGNKKKLGTRIADLESQLGLAQEELKSLKHQVGSVEAAKKVAHDNLEIKPNKQQNVPVEAQETAPNKKETDLAYETSDHRDVQQETDVFEVPTVEKVDVEPKTEDEVKPKSTMTELETSLSDELALKNDEINALKTNLDDKDKQLESFRQENESLKSQLDEKTVKISSAQSEIDELNLRLKKADEELENSKCNALEMNRKLEAAEKAKEELENEMKTLRVQSEQWRKAADAAANVLSGGMDGMGGRRISERCVSMDNHLGGVFQPVGGYSDYGGFPGLMIDDHDDSVFGGGKRKGSGIKMFGDLWKKKGQK